MSSNHDRLIVESKEAAMIKNRAVAFAIFVVVFMAFWNLLELLWCTFITKGDYHFSAGSDLGIPFGLALVLGYLLFLRNRS